MPISAGDFDFIRDLVRRRSAIVIEPGKEYLVESRLGLVARAEGFGSLSELIARLQAQSGNHLHGRVVEAMTTNETMFFRDTYPFDALREIVVAGLRARRGEDHQIVIWSLACSTGQEPYSIALVLREVGSRLSGSDPRIIAADISTEALARARQGRYNQVEVNRGLPVQYLAKYFTAKGSEWQLADDIRRMVEFREMNLVEPWPELPQPDIVFLRNVLIYFDVETKRAILGRIRRLLHPDGFLLLGGAETTFNLDDAFYRVPMGRATCYQLKMPAPV